MSRLKFTYSTSVKVNVTKSRSSFFVEAFTAFVENVSNGINNLCDFRIVFKRSTINFPGTFELLIWLFYVGLYKYSYYVEQSGLHADHHGYFPFPLICLFGICATLYIIPYYRWAVPGLLKQKKYGWLFLLTIIYFVFITTGSNIAVAWIFKLFTNSLAEQHFFKIMSAGFFIDWNLVFTDAIAFLCIAFARFSFQTEQQRHQVETDHLQLQLTMLKTQLQPHFLFNTLNSLYGMSLTSSKETPRFILLLSQMMQYILYDCDKEEVSLAEEAAFLQNYFEIEQKKFPQATITLNLPAEIPAINVPPLLFLPLVENSFKHGRHKLENNAEVNARLLIEQDKLIFKINNDTLINNTLHTKPQRGGIGLVNIKKRLQLYYPDKSQLTLNEQNHIYTAKLVIDLK